MNVSQNRMLVPQVPPNYDRQDLVDRNHREEDGKRRKGVHLMRMFERLPYTPHLLLYTSAKIHSRNESVPKSLHWIRSLHHNHFQGFAYHFDSPSLIVSHALHTKSHSILTPSSHHCRLWAADTFIAIVDKLSKKITVKVTD